MDARAHLSLRDRVMLPFLALMFGCFILVDELREVGWQRVLAGWKLRRAQSRVRKAHAYIAEEKRLHAQNMTLLHAELQVAVDRVQELDAMAEGHVS